MTAACHLTKYDANEVEEHFGDNDYWQEYGIDCELNTAHDRGSKAPAAQFLLTWIGEQSKDDSTVQGIWAGDAMNDAGMLNTGWKGIVVGNADERLKKEARVLNESSGAEHVYLAARRAEEGVIEGMTYWTEHCTGV